MAKLLHIFYHKEGTFSLLCQQVQLITVSKNKGITFTTRPLGTQTSSLHSFNGYFDALTVSKHTPDSPSPNPAATLPSKHHSAFSSLL